MTIQGLEAYKQWLSIYLAAFSNAHFTLEDLIVERDTVVVRQTFRGTHKGDLMGIPPTGKQVTATGIAITHVLNGKVVEQWNGATVLLSMRKKQRGRENLVMSPRFRLWLRME